MVPANQPDMRQRKGKPNRGFNPEGIAQRTSTTSHDPKTASATVRLYLNTGVEAECLSGRRPLLAASDQAVSSHMECQGLASALDSDKVNA